LDYTSSTVVPLTAPRKPSRPSGEAISVPFAPFTGARGRGILRTSPLRSSTKYTSPGTCETDARHTCRVSDQLQCLDVIEKGKPAARRGRKAYGPLKEVAGLPNRLERDQGWDQKEWEPSGALRSVLRGMSLLPGTDRNRDLVRLKPHLQEALETLERLERRRGLSDSEKMRGGRSGCC